MYEQCSGSYDSSIDEFDFVLLEGEFEFEFAFALVTF